MSGRRLPMAKSFAMGRLRSSWASRCSSVSATGTTVSWRSGSWASTSERRRRNSTGARRARKAVKLRAPVTSRVPSA